jgi:hypothetical protein
MAKLIIGNYIESHAKKTSIGASKNTNYNKARHKKHGKKKYRGQGR